MAGRGTCAEDASQGGAARADGSPLDVVPNAARDRARFFEWWLPVVLAAVLLGCLAARAERHFAPWLIFPLVFGATLGVLAAGWRSVRGYRGRTAERVGTVLAAMVLTVVQHAAGHRLALEDTAARWTDRQPPGGGVPRGLWPDWARRRLPAESLPAFLRQQAARGRAIGNVLVRGPWAWCSWLLDALLVMLAAAVVFDRTRGRWSGTVAFCTSDSDVHRALESISR